MTQLHRPWARTPPNVAGPTCLLGNRAVSTVRAARQAARLRADDDSSHTPTAQRLLGIRRLPTASAVGIDREEPGRGHERACELMTGEALTWFSRAADAGHARSLFWLGKLYWRGHGVREDRRRAAQLFGDAAGAEVAEAQRAVAFLARRAGRPTA